MKKLIVRTLLVLIALSVLAQFVPINRRNPPVTQDIGAPAQVEAILRASCYDCHSNETRWPWYSHVAPASWLLANDTWRARAMMNFSRWDTYSKKKQADYPDRIYSMVSSNQMPPFRYLMIHHDAKLDSAKIDVLENWKNNTTESRQ